MEHIKILNSIVHNISMKEGIYYVEKFIASGRSHRIVAMNAAKLVKMQYDKRLADIINLSSLILPDGKSIVWASRFLKSGLKGRVTGIDLMEELVRLSSEKGYRLYFLGAREEVVQRLVEVYRKRFPGLNIVGWHNGYFKTHGEEQYILEDIKSLRPHILFVGMESPFKEYWIDTNLGYLGVPVCMAVGGSFDVVGGFIKRAPLWMQDIGLEWFFRFLREPARLWKRYLFTNILFIWFILKEGFRKRVLCHNSFYLSLILSFTFFYIFTFVYGEINDRWFPYYIPWNYCSDSKIDMSFLLDPPAGKHGFVIVKDGHLYFEDGKRARFWGVNIHSNKACFPTHKQAEDIAKRLSQLGCNLVRMHLLDNEEPGGLIDSKYEDSQHFSDFQWERMDYFIYQLKKNGIYIMFDVLGLGARRFKVADNIPDYEKIKEGAPGISFFNVSIIELSKRYARSFLTHINPYTGNSYINEPAISMIQMSNENTLFSNWIIEAFPSYYKKEIQDIWEKWLADKRYASKKPYKDWLEDRRFKYEVQDAHQREMYRYLRSIGVRCPIGSSNCTQDNLNLLADSHMDFTDIHIYWDHPYRGKRIHNRPLIRQDYKNPSTLVNSMGRTKISSKPLIITEWDSIWPNEWRAVDMLTTAAYAALNDLDALCLYAYNGGWGLSWDGLENKIYYPTVVFNDPAKMGLFCLGALIFLRDTKPASNIYYAFYPFDALLDVKDANYDYLRLAGIPYVSRLEKRYGIDNNTSSGEIRYPDVSKIFNDRYRVESDTGEIITDFKKGIFILNTPKTISFSGFVGNEKKYESENLRIYTTVDFATFTITSLDGEDIPYSKRLLFTILGRVRNNGQRLAPHETKDIDDLERDVFIISTGTGPILVEGIESEIFIRSNIFKNIEIYPLDEYGRRMDRLQVNIAHNWCRFYTSGKYKTIYYEIIRE